MVSETDAAVSEDAVNDNLAPDGKPGDETNVGAEGQAGDAGSKDQPSESSPENKDQDSLQARFDELTGKYRGAERDAEYWKGRAMDAEGKIPTPQPEVKIEKTLEDFDNDVAAYTKYVADEAVKAAQAANDEINQQSRSVETGREFIARENDFARDVADYDEVTRNPNLAISPEMKEFIQADDQGPALLYYLGQNPAVAQQIAQLPPMQAAAEMARLQATELAKPAATQTQTPQPAQRLAGREHATAIDVHSPDSDKLKMDDWAKRWQKKEAKRRAGA